MTTVRGPARVTGFGVGHLTRDATGVTVVLAPDGTVGAAEVRGGAPATRELVALEPGRTVTAVHAVVFTGGSAFGLAAADGVMGFLAARGRGVETPAGPVPIVPTAAIYDLGRGADPPPTAADGATAAEVAEQESSPASGAVGAGRGARVGAWRGRDHDVAGGLGLADTSVDGAVVGVLAVVNAVGDVHDDSGRVLAGSTAPADVPGFPDPPPVGGAREATTLVVAATDAALDRGGCHLLAQSAHHGLARSVHPSHTRFDGDLAVVLAAGRVEASIDRLRVATAETTAAAIRDAVSGREER